ncbi:AraC family transcriptional regulator [Cohnella sp. GbtcB17]|uniref:AraC family transcriptional regulator n=1 Tax=Cohnella sp. GbtcB17 TaxID=2824762 RepID=UPI001C3106E3|nr:AraC family transcriptional regulator [Cohnella sp. GbtcB17]
MEPGANEEQAVVRDVRPLSGVAFEPGRIMGKARCEPGWSWHVQAMPDYDFWHVLSGTGSMTVNGSRYPIVPGCCFTLRPGDRIDVEQHPDDRLTVIYCHFRAAVDDEKAGNFSPPRRRVEVHDGARFEALMGRLLELRDMPPLWAEVEFDYTVKLLLLELYRSERETQTAGRASVRHRELVRRASDSLRQGAWAEGDLEAVAAEAGVSQRYLSQLFKRHTGRTLKSYAAGLRMERARLLLAESDMPVTQIADTLGYADLYSFSKLFKAYAGTSPSGYRKRSPAAVPLE